MTEDDAVRARVAGRLAKQGATLWRLEAGPLVFRCVRAAEGRGAVEVRDDSGQWVAVVGMEGEPARLLRIFATSQSVARALGGAS